MAGEVIEAKYSRRQMATADNGCILKDHHQGSFNDSCAFIDQ